VINPVKPWTVLVWSASDNDMYAYQVGDLDDMEKGVVDRLHIAAQVDHKPAGGPVERLEIRSDHQPGLHSPQAGPVLQKPMNDPQALADFIKWGVKEYPSDKVWLVISGHGDAWHGACETGEEAVYMGLPQLREALASARQETGKKLDLLSFDACYMGSVEAAYQLRDEARYMVGSQEEVGYTGMPYEEVLPQVPSLSPEELARKLVEAGSALPVEYRTLAAFDLEKVAGVAEAVKGLGEAVAASEVPLGKARDTAQEMYGYRDLHDLAGRLAEADPSLAGAAQQVQAAVSQAVIAEGHTLEYPGAHGLQIETRNRTPADYEASDEEWRRAYGETLFAQDTGWQKAWEGLNRPWDK